MEKEQETFQNFQKIKKLWHSKTENRMKNILSQFIPSFKIIGRDIKNPGSNLIAIDLGSLRILFVLVPNDKKPLSRTRRPVITLYIFYIRNTCLVRSLLEYYVWAAIYTYMYIYRAPLLQCNWRKPLESSYCIFSIVRV